MDLVGDRERLLDWASAKGDDGLTKYRKSKNAVSIDGIPGSAREPCGARSRAARERMNELDIEVLLLSVGADLPYLTGYEAMPLERLTMLVLPASGDAHLVVPRLEAPRVTPRPDLFDIVPWEETDDPIRLVAKLVGPATRSAAIGDNTWARFVLDLQRARPHTSFMRARPRSWRRSGW